MSQAAPAAAALLATIEPISARDSDKHPRLKELRQNIDFGVVCAWCALFGDALKIRGFDSNVRLFPRSLLTQLTRRHTKKLEQDLAGLIAPDSYVCWLISKMLATLTSDRAVKEHFFLPRLRREFMRREPAKTFLGLDKVPKGQEGGEVDWADVSMNQKVTILYSLCNWFFIEADKFREKLGATEADGLNWRIQPVGYDRAKNAYWLFDDNRLWIQRVVPRPEQAVRPTSKPPANNKRKAPPANAPATKKTKTTQPPTPPTNGTGALNRSTRRSQATDAEGWQAIPQEWLQAPSPAVVPANEDQDGNSSDLSDLSVRDSALTKQKPTLIDAWESEDEDFHLRVVPAYSPEPEAPPGFVRWQTVCVTVEDWHAFLATLDQKNVGERGLYKYISKEVLPGIEEAEAARKANQAHAIKELAKIEQEAKKPQLPTYAPRQRSTRIAIKELEADDRRSRRRQTPNSHQAETRETRRTRRMDREDSALLEKVLKRSVADLHGPESSAGDGSDAEDEAGNSDDESYQTSQRAPSHEAAEAASPVEENQALVASGDAEMQDVPADLATEPSFTEAQVKPNDTPPREDPKILDPNVETNPGPTSNGQGHSQEIAVPVLPSMMHSFDGYSSNGPSSQVTHVKTEHQSNSSADGQESSVEPQDGDGQNSSRQEQTPPKQESTQSSAPPPNDTKPAPNRGRNSSVGRGKKRKKDESDSEPEFEIPPEPSDEEYTGRGRRPRRAAAAKAKLVPEPQILDDDDSGIESEKSSSSSFAIPEDKSDTDFVPSDEEKPKKGKGSSKRISPKPRAGPSSSGNIGLPGTSSNGPRPPPVQVVSPVGRQINYHLMPQQQQHQHQHARPQQATAAYAHQQAMMQAQQQAFRVQQQQGYYPPGTQLPQHLQQRHPYQMMGQSVPGLPYGYPQRPPPGAMPPNQGHPSGYMQQVPQRLPSQPMPGQALPSLPPNVTPQQYQQYVTYIQSMRQQQLHAAQAAQAQAQGQGQPPVSHPQSQHSQAQAPVPQTQAQVPSLAAQYAQAGGYPSAAHAYQQQQAHQQHQQQQPQHQQHYTLSQMQMHSLQQQQAQHAQAQAQASNSPYAAYGHISPSGQPSPHSPYGQYPYGQQQARPPSSHSNQGFAPQQQRPPSAQSGSPYPSPVLSTHSPHSQGQPPYPQRPPSGQDGTPGYPPQRLQRSPSSHSGSQPSPHIQ